MRNKFKIIFLKRLFLMLFSIGACIQGLEATSLKKIQIENLKMIEEVAKTYPNKNGETFEKTAMGICLTETQCGLYKIGDLTDYPNIYKASLGIMQVRLQTVKYMAKKLKLKEVLKLKDEELVSKLLNDNKFNAQMGINYLVWQNNRTKDYFRTVSRYNGGNNNYKYVKKVMANIRFLEKEFN